MEDFDGDHGIGVVVVALHERARVAGEADFDVFLGEVVAVDEDFADLVFGVGVLALFFVVAFGKEVFVAVLDDRF